MSKKVVHSSDDAHELAKAHCKDSGMKMSDWVAMLIKRATDPMSGPVAVQHSVALAPVVQHAAIREPLREVHAVMPSQALMSPRPVIGGAFPTTCGRSGPRRSRVLREARRADNNEDAVPVYAQPPFWARKSSKSSRGRPGDVCPAKRASAYSCASPYLLLRHTAREAWGRSGESSSVPAPRTCYAAVAELVDAKDLKSFVRKGVRVQFPAAALLFVEVIA